VLELPFLYPYLIIRNIRKSKELIMSMSTLTQKGQTTIPQDIRVYLGVHAGDKLEFFIDQDGRVVLAPLTEKVTALKGLLAKPKKKVTVEKMNEIIAKRGGGRERD
jgi:AbrB family looped-hinge helix DNA binding protein